MSSRMRMKSCVSSVMNRSQPGLPWTRTQWFRPSSPARLLARQVYRPASSTCEHINSSVTVVLKSLHADDTDSCKYFISFCNSPEFC